MFGTTFFADNSYGIGGIDSYTKLMLHLDNNVVDSEITPKTVTNNGVTFSNVISKFSYSGVFDGSTSYLTVTNSSDFNFDANFTVDLWLNMEDNSVNMEPICNGDLSSGDNGWGIYYESIGPTLKFFVKDAGGFNYVQNTQSFTNGSWYHIAAVRSSSIITLYVNGSSIGTLNYGTGTISSSNNLFISKRPSVSIGYVKGNMDEVRISKGIARWTANFTPPAAPYIT